MHAGTIHTIFRFWHKGCMKTMALRDGFDHKFKRANVICCLQRLVIFEINLMLCRRIFMVGRFHFKSHILQRQYHISSGIFSKIQRSHIKISCLLMGDGSRHSIIIYMVQEELALWSHIKGIAKGGCFADHFFQDIPGISLIAGAVRTIHITDQAGYFPLLGSPWKCRKCTVIRIQIHITLFHANKSFCGRTIKHHFIIQCFFQMTGCDCHIFHIAEQICEL